MKPRSVVIAMAVAAGFTAGLTGCTPIPDYTYVTVTSGRGSPPLRGLTMRQQDQVCAVHIAEGEGDLTKRLVIHGHDEFGALGDTSTLADPTVVDDLIENRQNRRVG